MKIRAMTLLPVAAIGLTACEGIEGTTRYTGPNDYIAVANDQGRDSSTNFDDNAAVAVTPDGCQVWIIDDGLEGRASNRMDPVSGLPVCGGEPGVVYGPYQSGTQGIRDGVPRRLVPTGPVEQVEVRTTRGHYHADGSYHTDHSH